MSQENKKWTERYELEIQIVVLVISVILVGLGLLIQIPTMVAAGFLGSVFSLTYIGYAYVRRYR
ncbi:MAG: hypothetical protein GX369_01280 [Euryarchaeota archaeon]|nr:hypothetical protein [Euryarchaeota archaeon]